MVLCNPNHNLGISKSQNKIPSNSSSKKNNVLCNHCKRTANNGIRCLGMCVADNDY